MLTMKIIISNAGYFLRETATMIRQSKLTNFLSMLSICMVLFILAMVFSGWRMVNHVADMIQDQAEINVFYNEGLDSAGVSDLQGKLKSLEGVRSVELVDEREAYDRMVKILGDEAKVLKIFDENPFSPMIEVRIHLDKIEPVLSEIKHIPGIGHVQSNQAVLERLRNIDEMVRDFGLLVVAAVGISTVIIISQIIRLGIQNNSEQINTLRLLGAPEYFIALPFLLEGLLLTGSGGFLAASLAGFLLNQMYVQVSGHLSFIPLLPARTLITSAILGVTIFSIILGTIGSMIGLTTAKEK